LVSDYGWWMGWKEGLVGGGGGSWQRGGTGGLAGSWEGGGEAKVAFVAPGTEGDIFAGEAQHHLLPGLGLGSGGRGCLGLGPQELAAEEDAVAAYGVGKEAVVADPGEARRQDMEEEAAQERGRGQAHVFEAVAVGPVPVAEGNLVVLGGDEAFVGQGDALGVATQVGQARLREIGTILITITDADVEVHGHTDSTRPEDYNMGLSQRRAEAVQRFLLENFSQLRADQFTIRAFGETQPIATNDTREGRALNRRVEIKLITG
jgi:outer membrane protein OmpA-like peptidoglycan-associated protein